MLTVPVDFVETSMVFLSIMSSFIMVNFTIIMTTTIFSVLHCIFGISTIIWKCRSQNQPHRVWQQPQSPSSKRWLWGPVWGGGRTTGGHESAGFMQGVCEFFYTVSTYFYNADIYLCNSLAIISNFFSITHLFPHFSKPPVTRWCVQSPGAPAPNW